MSDSIEKFVGLLLKAELLTRSQLQELRAKLEGDGHSLSDEELAQRLADSGHLTDFQADELRKGKLEQLIVGDYVILSPMGRGGMGQVFRARHTIMKREVAIKFTLADDDGKIDQISVTRFQREVEAASKLLHPNIVSSLDAGHHGGVCYLVMEYVRGMNLAVYVHENGPMSFRKALDCTLQIAQGLEYAHAQGVVHRDIKPGNILYTSDGRVKILDMGLVRMHTSEEANEHAATEDPITCVGQLLGTVEFMAPEQAVDPHGSDARADIYSLGCTLYFLLTASPPFRRRGSSTMSRIIAHREMPVPSLCEARADVPASFERVFQKMMAKPLRKRYQTMTELIADLRKAQLKLNDSEISLTETKTMRSVRKLGSSRTFQAICAAVAVLIVVGSAVFFANRRPKPDSVDRGATSGGVRGPSKAGSPSTLPVEIPTEPLDLLAHGDLTQYATRGKGWSMDAGKLLVPDSVPSKLIVPVTFPAQFELALRVTRVGGSGPMIVGMNEKGRSFVFLIDRLRADKEGEMHLTAIGFKEGRLATTQYDMLRLDANQPVDLTLAIDKKSVVLKAAGETVLKWEGTLTELALGQGWDKDLGNATGLLIGSNDKGSFEISRLQIIPQPAGEATVP